jgi:hypothetical protein
VTSVVGFLYMSIPTVPGVLVMFKSRQGICLLFSSVSVNCNALCCLLKCSNICSGVILSWLYIINYLNILHPVVCIVNDILIKADNTTIRIDTNYTRVHRQPTDNSKPTSNTITNISTLQANGNQYSTHSRQRTSTLDDNMQIPA